MNTDSSDPVRPSRRGRAASAVRPEQVFFDDPAVDRLMGVLMALAMEHYVLHDRVRALEQQLAAAGYLPGESLGQTAPQQETDADRADAAAFAEELLRPLLGLQQSVGATGRFTLRNKGRPRRA